jgi:hypothetical protein
MKMKGEIGHKEADNDVSPFNIKHKLSKIKIHVIVIELDKNTPYHK